MFAALIQSLAALDVSSLARNVRRSVIGYSIAGLCLVVGLAFLLAAAFIFTARRYGALEACLGFGVVFVVLAVVTLVVQKLLTSMEKRRRAREAKANQLTTLAGATAVAMLPALLKSRGGMLGAMLPLLAVAAYAIYNENAREPDRSDDSDDKV